MSINQPDFLLTVPSGSLQIPAACTPERVGGAFKSVPDQWHTERPILFSLVLPTYNEGKTIEKLVHILSQLLDEVIPQAYELIVVDDNSPDRTWELAMMLMPDYPQLRVMRRIEERGLSTAVIRGWQVAQGKILGVMDADLQHPPEVLLQLWSEMGQGADLAIASRHLEGGGVSDWSLMRRFLSRGAQILGLILLPGIFGRVSDPMSGYFLVRRSSLAGQTLQPVGYKILIEVLARGKVRWIAEAGYVFQERQAGDSKVTWKQYVEYLQHLLKLRLSLWPMGRFIRFGLVGFSGVFIDLGVFYILRNQLDLALTRSAILSAEVAIINNFLWNDWWTFGDIASRQRGRRKRFKRLLKFNIICLAGLVLNVSLVNLLFNIFGVNEYIAKLIAIAAVTLWNFWINLKLSWRVTEVD